MLVGEQGLDTVALLWPCQGGSAAMTAIGESETYRHARGVVCAKRPASGIRVMAWPDYGVIKAEGRLAAAIDGDSGSYRLAAREEALQADEAMREAVRELLGHEPDGRAVEVGRADLTTERVYDDPRDANATLGAIAALARPGYLARPFIRPGGVVQSVALVTAKRAVPAFRAYDKGLESGSHPAGERVRFEVQRRLPKPRRITPRQLANDDLRSAFARTIEPFVREANVSVTHPTTVVDELARRVQSGDLTVARAERLAGSIEFLRRYGRAIYADDRQSWRRLRALEDAGIAVTEHVPPDRVVPVGDLLADVVEEWSA